MLFELLAAPPVQAREQDRRKLTDAIRDREPARPRVRLSGIGAVLTAVGVARDRPATLFGLAPSSTDSRSSPSKGPIAPLLHRDKPVRHLQRYLNDEP